MLLFIPLISTSVNYHSAGFIQKVVIKGFNYLGVGFSLRNIMLFILVFVVFKSIFLFLSEVYSVYFVNKYKVNTTNKMFSAYQDIDWRFAITQDQGYLMNYILNIPDKNANLLLQLISGISTIISILIFIIFSLVISIGLTVLTLSFMVLSGIVYLYFLSKIKKCGYQGFKLTHELFKMVAQYIRGNKAVRSFDVRDAVKKYVDNTTRKRMDNIIGLNLLEISYVSITRVMLALAVFAILFLFIELLGYPIGEVIVVCIFFVKIVQKEKNIRTFSKVARYLPSLERLDVLYLKFLKHKNERCISGYKINTFENSIEFKDVNYSYEIESQKKYEKENRSINVKEKNCLHIKGINLKIKKGKTVVFTGASGAGKTTLLDLLMGLIEPGSGEIIIDRIPLTEINLSSWRRLIGYVSQASFLLNDTIYNNIVFQRKISKKDVEKA
ncbi:MAG: ABC transporter ATP-binding protein, partial [Candidatus Omnitrophota bacterium]